MSCLCTLIAEKVQPVLFLNLQPANIGSFTRLGIPQLPRPCQRLPISLQAPPHLFGSGRHWHFHLASHLLFEAAEAFVAPDPPPGILPP
jgi:hypothetical protein